MISCLVPPELSVLSSVALLGISFMGSFITAAFGIGGGVVVLAVFASLLSPAALIPIHGVVQLGSNAGRAIIMRAHIDWPIWSIFVIGTFVGVVIGGVIVIDLPPQVIQIAIGCFVFWSVMSRPPAIFRRSAWLVGIISSTLTMFFGATGPFVSAYLKTRNYDRMGQVAMQGACMTVQHGLKVIAFGILGFAFGPYIPLVVGMIAFGFIGTIVGRRVLMRIDEKRFKLALNGILILLSLRLIWSGFSSFL